MEAFVGRAAELRLFEAALAGARSGSGRLITVSGPAGVGKTRYCEEGAGRARAGGFAVAWGRCWTGGGAPALWPWQAILSELCGEEAAKLLDGASDPVDPQRFSRFVAVVDRLAMAGAGGPAVLVVDDVHAADPGALLLTRFVARSLHRLPLVMITTRRTGPDGAEPLADLEREGVPVLLRGFDLDETRAFLAGHGAGPADPTVVEAVHAVSEGCPLLLRRLVALGVDPSAGLPGGLRAVIDETLRTLRPLSVRLLTAGAILGMTVDVAEAARLVGAGPAAVLEALREAAGSGLVHLAGTDSFTFCHDLVRQALAERIPPERRRDAHARAVEVIWSGGSHERLGRLAHHAVHAAPRSSSDARVAVRACRAAARSMARHLAYERAAALLATATQLHDGADLGPAPAQLLLEWAYATHRCGRLPEARSLFDRAAAAARVERDAVLFAEAVLGAGGTWVSERRDRVERERLLALHREALAGLPDRYPALRCRLTLRQATEPGRGPGDVLAALEQARGTGDRRVLAEALSLCHHAMLGPEHARQRLAMADELIAVASADGLEVVTLVGLCWRTVDLFQLGDPGAERALADLRHRSDLLPCNGVRYVQAAMEVMLLIRAGRLAEAERAAVRCLRLGIEIGDDDARACHGAQLMTIGWLRGGGADLVDLAEQTAGLTSIPDREPIFLATLALLAADAGQFDRARSALLRVTAGGLATIKPGSTWLGTLFAIVEAAAALAESEIAEQAYTLLEPFADRPIMPSMAVVCFGSTERILGLAALTFGDLDRAVAHLERAVTANLRLANRPLTAVARANLAETLRRRGDAGDQARADELLDLAIADATEIGMTARAEAWAAGQEPAPALTIVRAGDRWRFTHRGRDTLLDDLVGFRYLARLVACPGTEIAALDLVAEGQLADPANHAVLDERARVAYARRARELAGELAAARRDADLARVARLEVELDALTAEIQRSTGINGHPRHFGGPAERARTAVRKAITRAINTIAATEPEAADLLRAAVTTGYHCVYRPGVGHVAAPVSTAASSRRSAGPGSRPNSSTSSARTRQ